MVEAINDSYEFSNLYYPEEINDAEEKTEKEEAISSSQSKETLEELSYQPNYQSNLYSLTSSDFPHRGTFTWGFYNNLKLYTSSNDQKQSSTIYVNPGQTIYGNIDIFDDSKTKAPDTVNKISFVILKTEEQTCIYPDLTKNEGWNRDIHFSFQAPQEKGTYEVRIRYTQSYKEEGNANNWWERSEEMTVAKIIVS